MDLFDYAEASARVVPAPQPAPIREVQRPPDEPEQFNPFARSNNALQLGETLDLRDVYERYTKPALLTLNRQRKTIGALERNLRLFEAWWADELTTWEKKGHVEMRRPIVAFLTIQHLTKLQGWLVRQGRSGLYANNTLRAIRQILRSAELNGLILRAPCFKALPERRAAPKIYVTDDQLTDLWRATEPRTWPRKRRGFRPLHYASPLAWKCCIVLWTLYGFRTQELIALDKEAKPITWGHVFDQLETPNPAGHTKNEWGWLVYTPTKQSWCKPDPIYWPLTIHARAALEHLRPADWKPETAICDWTFSSTSFYKSWHGLVADAGIKPKTGDPLEPKHLRKTASTRSDDWKPGTADHIVGHAPDRSGTAQVADAGSKISGVHYKNSENKILECLSTIPLPACFDEILSCKVA